MLRNVVTLVLVVGLGVVAARLLADRGYRLSWPPRHAAPAAANGPGVPGAAPFPTGPSAEEAAQREMASCASPLSSAEVRIRSCTVAIASGRLSEVNRAAAFCDRGTGHDMKREAALAAAGFDEAVRIGPGAATGHVCRGHAELTRGAVDAAIADYGQAIELDPNSHQAYGGLGNAHLRQNDVERAIADYTRSIALDDRDPITLVDRGGAYLRQKRYPLAIADLTRTLELDPQNVTALVERAQARMGTRSWEAAASDLDAALHFAPDDAEARRLRGYCRYAEGDDAGALADGQAALKLDPRSPVTYLDASRARLKGRR